MKGHEKILQLNSHLSKLIDSFCFELSVNFPDENSLSLIEIIDWKTNSEVSHDEFKQLYLRWLQSKNIYDLFTAKPIKTYPKQQLINFQGPLQNILSQQQITKHLEILNHAYNQIYIEKRVKGLTSATPKSQVKFIQDVEQLFSLLDSQGVINLRLSQLFFLNAALLLADNKPIPPEFSLFQTSFKHLLNDLGEINGCVSLRTFKNYFLIQKAKPNLVKIIAATLLQIQTLSHFANETKSKTDKLPDLFAESLQKWKSYPRFKNHHQKIDFLKRLFEENQRPFIFTNDLDTSNIQAELKSKYGKQFINVLEIDSKLLNQFTQILQDTLNKYLNLFQKITPPSKPKNHKTQYINSSTELGQDFHNSIQTSTNKKKMENSILHSGTKNLSKTAQKERTPQKKQKTNNEFAASNNYTSSNNHRNRTPTHNRSQIYGVHRQFGSAEKTPNGKGGRQTTPTKSTLSFMTEAPKTYRAAQKRGLTNNNIYDKLFFFRNKRVESYEIVMKRLKNK